MGGFFAADYPVSMRLGSGRGGVEEVASDFDTAVSLAAPVRGLGLPPRAEWLL